jgi:hypothetical protein
LLYSYEVEADVIVIYDKADVIVIYDNTDVIVIYDNTDVIVIYDNVPNVFDVTLTDNSQYQIKFEGNHIIKK